MPNITIAIDGYSSTGKSTVAKQLADWLDYVYVDTGAMYRAVTLYAMQNGMIENETVNREKLITALPYIRLDFQKNENGKAEIGHHDSRRRGCQHGAGNRQACARPQNAPLAQRGDHHLAREPADRHGQPQQRRSQRTASGTRAQTLLQIKR